MNVDIQYKLMHQMTILQKSHNTRGILLPFGTHDKKKRNSQTRCGKPKIARKQRAECIIITQSRSKCHNYSIRKDSFLGILPITTPSFVHHKVSSSNILRMVLPKITKFCMDISYITSIFRSEVIAKKKPIENAASTTSSGISQERFK